MRLWGASKKIIQPDLQFFGKNAIGIDIIFDLPFTFLMRNVSGRAMLPDSTVRIHFTLENQVTGSYRSLNACYK